MAATRCLSSHAMTRLLEWRNPRGAEENWRDGILRDDLQVHKVLATEVSLALLATIALVESAVCIVLTTCSLIFICTHRDLCRFYINLLASSSFTMCWALTDLVKNIFQHNLITKESFARIHAGRAVPLLRICIRDEDEDALAAWHRNNHDFQWFPPGEPMPRPPANDAPNVMQLHAARNALRLAGLPVPSPALAGLQEELRLMGEELFNDLREAMQRPGRPAIDDAPPALPADLEAIQRLEAGGQAQPAPRANGVVAPAQPAPQKPDAAPADPVEYGAQLILENVFEGASPGTIQLAMDDDPNIFQFILAKALFSFCAGKKAVAKIPDYFQPATVAIIEKYRKAYQIERLRTLYTNEELRNHYSAWVMKKHDENMASIGACFQQWDAALAKSAEDFSDVNIPEPNDPDTKAFFKELINQASVESQGSILITKCLALAKNKRGKK